MPVALGNAMAALVVVLVPMNVIYPYMTSGGLPEPLFVVAGIAAPASTGVGGVRSRVPNWKPWLIYQCTPRLPLRSCERGPLTRLDLGSKTPDSLLCPVSALTRRRPNECRSEVPRVSRAGRRRTRHRRGEPGVQPARRGQPASRNRDFAPGRRPTRRAFPPDRKPSRRPVGIQLAKELGKEGVELPLRHTPGASGA